MTRIDVRGGWVRPPHFARNSPAGVSTVEVRTLEFRGFLGLQGLVARELRAELVIVRVVPIRSPRLYL